MFSATASLTDFILALKLLLEALSVTLVGYHNGKTRPVQT